MSVLTNTSGAYNLSESTLIVVQIEAKNYIGYSIPSNENSAGAVAQIEPKDPTTAPPRDASTSTS
jgi:hypothetical protein